MEIYQMRVVLIRADRQTYERTHEKTDYFSNALRKHLQMRHLASRIRACADGTVRHKPKKDTRTSFHSTNKEAN